MLVFKARETSALWVGGLSGIFSGRDLGLFRGGQWPPHYLSVREGVLARCGRSSSLGRPAWGPASALGGGELWEGAWFVTGWGVA